VHHGGVPRYTNLLDPWFAVGLARHAERVARRYPWVKSFTPINEPLTTARFSGLYGHWFPHRTDEKSFLRILFNQVRAVSLSMSTVREVTPEARLVQTEDLGRVFSTSQLQYQADYENERRWLSFDLLCGKVRPDHRFHDDFIRAGIDRRELEGLVKHPTPPDCVGVNHYLTSDRYLDHAWWLYPPEFKGRNGLQEYADVDAVRLLHLESQTGPRERLREAWKRYRLPLAVTEAHHASTPEEQARWLLDVWNAASLLRQEGADIRAVTAWSIYGAVDWNSLLTRRAGFYEPGAFDVRQSPPSPTRLAAVIAQLCHGGHYTADRDLPRGWWQRPDRAYQRRGPERRVV
jgi:dTDP-4-dehydrorhamnose reductase